MSSLTIAAYVTVVVAALFLFVRKPIFGIAALIAVDPFDWAHPLGPTQITLSKAVLVGVAIACVAKRPSLAALREPAIRPLFGGAVAIAIVTALSAVPGTYIDAVAREALKASEYLVLFAVGALASGESTDDDETLWSAIIVVATSVCALALVEEFRGAHSAVLIGGRTIARIAGPLEGPNQLAGYLDLMIPLVLARALARREIVVWAVAGTLVLTDVLTLSRSGLFGAVIGIGIVVGMQPQARRAARRIALAAGLAAVALLTILARVGAISRVASVGESRHENGLATRSELWHAAIALWRTDPALGIGAGNFELLLPTVGLYGVRTHANSVYLQALAEGGIALAAATLWTVVSAIVVCFRDARRSTLLLGIGAGTCALAAHQVFDDMTFFPKIGGMWWLLLGIAAARVAALRLRTS